MSTDRGIVLALLVGMFANGMFTDELGAPANAMCTWLFVLLAWVGDHALRARAFQRPQQHHANRPDPRDPRRSPRVKVLCCHPSAERYGADRIFAESVRAFTEAGWQVTVTLPDDGELVPILREAGADVVFCPTPVLRKAALRPAGLCTLLADTARAIAPMTRLLRRVRPDLVYVNTVTVPAWLAMAKLLGKRVVAHVHEAEDAVPCADPHRARPAPARRAPRAGQQRSDRARR